MFRILGVYNFGSVEPSAYNASTIQIINRYEGKVASAKDGCSKRPLNKVQLIKINEGLEGMKKLVRENR